MSQCRVVKFGSIESGAFKWNGEWRIGEGENWTEIVSSARRQYKVTRMQEMFAEGVEPTDATFQTEMQRIAALTCIGDEIL